MKANSGAFVYDAVTIVPEIGKHFVNDRINSVDPNRETALREARCSDKHLQRRCLFGLEVNIGELPDSGVYGFRSEFSQGSAFPGWRRSAASSRPHCVRTGADSVGRA